MKKLHVAITGKPGVGKTSLLAALRRLGAPGFYFVEKYWRRDNVGRSGWRDVEIVLNVPDAQAPSKERTLLLHVNHADSTLAAIYLWDARAEHVLLWLCRELELKGAHDPQRE